MRKLFKVISGILLCVFGIFLMSDNTFAFDVTTPVSYVDSIYSGGVYFCSDSDSSIEHQGGSCGLTGKSWLSTGVNRFENKQRSISGIRWSSGAYSIPAGSILALPFYVSSYGQAMNFNNMTGVTELRNANNGANYITVLDNTYVQLNSNAYRWTVFVKVNNSIPANTHLYFVSNAVTGDVATSNNIWGYNFLWFRDSNSGIIAGTGLRYIPSSNSGSSFDDSDILQSLSDIYLKLDELTENSSSATISDMNEAIQEQKEAEQQAVDNIGDQTADDISDSSNTENAATDNLIGVFSSFVEALTDINAGTCVLTLNLPSYAGGTINVNVCQNKDKAGNLISIFSSLTLIIFYIPLAIRLLTMIYNEIRSFTNG